MLKNAMRVVAVAFGVMLAAKTFFVEHLLHTGEFSSAYMGDAVELIIAWFIILGGVTAYIVRRATPSVTHVHNYHDSDGDDDSDESDD